MKTYAGIGNRHIPDSARAAMEDIGAGLARLGWSLRSGGAEGADSAFEAGHLSAFPMGHRERIEILRPSICTEAARAVAALHHPAWGACTDHARNLLGRNVQIILGPDLDAPVNLVLAYCVDTTRGGTALALRVASEHGIRVVNLAG